MNKKTGKKFLSVRLDAGEMEHLKTQAAASNLRVSDFVREVLELKSEKAAKRIQRAAPRYLPDAATITAIARANNNLNQIARALNTANRSGAEVTLRTVVGQLEDIRETLRDVQKGRAR